MNGQDALKAEQEARGALLSVKEMHSIGTALAWCDDFLADQEDIRDGDYGVPQPNQAMQLRQIVGEAMDALDRAMNRVIP